MDRIEAASQDKDAWNFVEAYVTWAVWQILLAKISRRQRRRLVLRSQRDCVMIHYVFACKKGKIQGYLKLLKYRYALENVASPVYSTVLE